MLQFLIEYHREGPALLNQIKTGDKMRVHHHFPKSKRVNMAWCEPRKKGLQRRRLENRLRVNGQPARLA